MTFLRKHCSTNLTSLSFSAFVSMAYFYNTVQFLLVFPLIIIFFFINFSLAQRPIFPNSIVIPVTKDASTHQYVAKIYVGATLTQVPIVLDLNAPFLWLVDSADHHPSSPFSSSQHKIIKCSSLKCSMAKAASGVCITTAGEIDEEKICSIETENTIKKVAASGGLAEDVLAVEFRDGSDTVGGVIVTMHDFLFSSAPIVLLQGLASGVKGMLGLGSTRISLPSQLSIRFGFQNKFAMCLSSSSSSHGVILAGDGPCVSASGMDISKSLMYTPLLSNEEGYHINVKSIKVNGMRISVNSSLVSLDEKGNGGVKISTILPYTSMKSTVYEAFVEAYEEFAIGMGMARVAPVAPFDVCFSLESDKEERMDGPNVPSIDFVLQSEMVKWRVHGRNSLVRVSDDVMCLGFLNGGLSQKASIVIGGHQLEENLLEFNLGTSMLGFASLVMGQKSCSDFALGPDVLLD